MESFKFLTIVQISALSDEDRTAYETALAKFKADFLTANPSGIGEYSARILKVNAIAKRSKKTGKFRVAMHVNIPNETVANAVAVDGNVLLLDPSVADIVAEGAGFFNWGHFAITTAGCFKKGEFTLSVRLNVKGETWKGNDGSTGVYKSTHLAILGYEYSPSPEVNGKVNIATANVIETGYANMMNASNVVTVAPKPVLVTEDGEDDGEVNP